MAAKFNIIRIFRPAFYFSIIGNQLLWFKFEGMITSDFRTSRNSLEVGNVEENYEVSINTWTKLCR
jgi:hypothetical protein